MAGDELTPAVDAAGDAVRLWLATVEAELSGSPRWRAGVVAELRDGLDDASARYRAEGRDAVGAARAACREFGDPRKVAAGFAGEAGAVLARRVALGLLASGPVAALLWLTAWHQAPGAVGRWMPVVGPLIGVAAVAAATAAVSAAGRGVRWSGRWPALSPVAATMATGVCVVADLLMLSMFGAWVAAAPTVVWPAAAAALTFSAVRLLLAAHATTRCAARAGRVWLATRGT